MPKQNLFFQSLSASLIVLSVVAISAQPCAAEVGVTPTEIKIGMVNDQSGPNKNLGTEVRIGAQVAFDKINAGGGILKRKLELLVRDDKYDPHQTFVMAKELVEKEQVFALMGSVGTSTSNAARPVYEAGNIPFLMPFTGADFLRIPLKPYVFPERASYEEEGEALVHHIVDVLKLHRVAIFTQADGFGDAGKQAVYRALAKRNLKGAGEGFYQRGSIDVEPALKTLMASKPEAVVLFSILKPAAAFLTASKKAGFAPVFAGASPIGLTQLIEEVGPLSDDVIFADSMPLTSNTSLAIVQDYRNDMKASGHEHLTPTSLEGYIGAKIVAEGIRRAGSDLSRDTFKQAMERFGDFDFEGVHLKYTPEQHEGMTHVYLFRAKSGKLELL